MPATARSLGVRNSFDVEENIRAGVRHLRDLQDTYKDDRLALAAYNAGAGAVKRLGPSERGKVEIISDNPAIPNRIVPLEDVRIIGRVVWSGRRH